MKAKSILLAIAAAICCAAEAVVYVKPGASGTGASWSDAADLATAVSSAYAGSSVTTIYVAKGVYTLSATLNLNGNVALYGGFAGASADETPETRDLAENVTIISGDVNGDDVWTRYYPLTGTSAATAEPIVKDGKINDLAFDNDYDTCAPSTGTLSDNVLPLISVAASAANTCVLDGFTLTGGGRGPSGSHHTAINVSKSAVPVIVHNRIVGCFGMQYCVFFDYSSPTFVSNAVEFCACENYGVLGGDHSSAVVKNCTFTGNVRDPWWNQSGAAAAVNIDRDISLSGCVFTRNYCRHTRTGCSDNSCALSCADYSEGYISGCTFSCNSVYETTEILTPIARLSSFHYARVTGCTFLRNRTIVATTTAAAHLAATLYAGTGTRALDGVSFLTNTVSVTASAATSVRAATVFQGSSGCLHIVNGTFEENEVTVSAPEGADVLTARGVLQDATTGYTAIFNSTFTGSTPGPDVLSRQSTAGTYGLFSLNSVFWATGAAAATPRLVGGSASPAVVRKSIVSNPDGLGSGITLEDVYGEDPKLGAATKAVTGKPAVVRLGAMLPHVRSTYDVALTSASYYQFRESPTAAWESCQTVSATWSLLADALGVARSAGNFTVGAAQDLTEAAENGLTVVYRMDPENVARLDGETVQVIAIDGTTTPVTGVSTNDNYVFKRWRDADGTEYSTDNPVTVTASEAGSLALTAQFNPTSVKYTFDLGEFATFDDDGTTNKVLTVVPDDPVTIPAYTMRDGFAFKAWTPEVPSTVGTLDARFDLLAHRRDLYLKAGEDIAAAVNEATNYPGQATVHLAAGVYEPAASINLPSQVRLVGEKGAVIRRTQSQWTIAKSADQTRSDRGWLEIEGITFECGGISPGSNPVRITDCVFTNCNHGEAGALSLYTNAVVVNSGFYDCQMAIKANGNTYWPIWFRATNCVFRGNRNAPESGGRQFGSVAALSSCKATVFYGCLFEKNRSANKGSQYGILSGGSMTLRRCRFVDNVCTGDLAVVTLGYAASCALDHTLFLRNRLVGDRGSSSTGWAAIIGDGTLGSKQIVNCAFVSNVVERTEAATSASTTILPCAILYRNSIYSAFRCNFFEGNSVTATATSPDTTPVCTILAFSTDSSYSMEGNTFHDNVAANGAVYLHAGTGGTWVWNSLFVGEGAEAAPFRHASDSVTGQFHLRFTRAPVQDDARVIRDATCGAGIVTFASRTEEVDGLVIRPLKDVRYARLNPTRWYYTSNDKKCRYDASLVGRYDTGYRNLKGDCTDAYLTKPYTTATDMFGEAPEGSKALVGAYQKRAYHALHVIVR